MMGRQGDRSMDTKLALGMARSDARRLSRSIDGKMDEFASAVFGLVSERFRAGRRLTPAELRALVADTDRIVGGEMSPVARRGYHLEPTRARPKGEAFERLSLHVIPKETPQGHSFGIWSFRMLASARRVVCDTMHTGLQFHLHTVQRVLERSDNVDAGEPVAATARAILSHAGRLFAAIEASKARGCDVGLMLPFGYGMLAGTVEEAAVAEGDPPLYMRSHFDDTIGLRRAMPHPVFGARPRLATLRTFVPGELMRPSQAAYTDLWNDLRDNHPVLEASAKDCVWPTRQLWQPERADAEALRAARVAVHDLAFDRVFRDDASRRVKFVSPAPLAGDAEPDFSGAFAPAM